VRTTQVVFTDPYPHLSIATISGDPPVLRLALNFGYRGSIAASFGSGPPPPNLLNKSSAQLWSSVSLVREEALPPIAVTIVNDVIGQADPARQAVSAALLTAAGVPPTALDSPLLHPGAPAPPAPGTATAPKPGTPVYAAAQRFAALPAASRHAWLAAHLSALRAGHVTLAEVP
jgi:hypothetical protein